MYVQPFMLTALAGRAPLASVFAVRNSSATGSSDCSSCPTQTTQSEPATSSSEPSSESDATSESGATSRRAVVAGQTDTVQISRQAQAALAEELTPEEQAEVAELEATDRKVRSHEQAHLAAAGPYARGGISYEYETGPDDNEYAVGGEVNIDTAPVTGDPEATIRKAQVIRAAAQAPADPSGQDRRVASAATQMEADARQEIREQQVEELAARREASESEANGQVTSTSEVSNAETPTTGAAENELPSTDQPETPNMWQDSTKRPAVMGTLLDLVG